MTKNPRTPCSDCPYRKDSPLAKWHAEEFQKVQKSREAEQSDDPRARLTSGIFACHKHGVLPPRERGWCAGWALMQREEGVPSIPLRLLLHTSPGAAEDFAALTPGQADLFSSPEEMVEANKEADGPRPRPRSRKR